jgi:hypothetical protein
LSQKYAELLDSRLKAWNVLHEDTEIRFFRNRQNAFKEFFSQENDLVFCNDICCVTEAVGHHHGPPQWRLFIASSKARLKVVIIKIIRIRILINCRWVVTRWQWSFYIV